MILVKPSIEFMDMNSLGLKLIERAGRTCYKSEDKIAEGTDEKFVQKLLDREHHAMLEFGWLCYRVICDRGVTHEIVRHRLFSFAQESTRYCNYGEGVVFIIPNWCRVGAGEYTVSSNVLAHWTAEDKIWLSSMVNSESCYKELLRRNWIPQQARSVLPNSLKTEIVMGGNYREWMHFFDLRCSLKAHPQMQEVANMIREDATKRVPIIFGELL
ncbi:hypothetical protein LCGC14_1270780 [marine sediment metagenome]|uniref:Thymidylate synthase (FAD) n=1 Tax=marine sediment metagenome TaxID=412755 RepID=A0A0F9NEU8_9ZZZZ